MSASASPYQVERADISFQLVAETSPQSEIYGGVSPSNNAGSNQPRAEPVKKDNA